MLAAEDDKEYDVHPKFEIITAQMPLHSISEDVNSPYFASSPSNLTVYVRSQCTPGKDHSMKQFIPKFSNTTDMNEDSSSACKNLAGNTFHTITSISEKDLENTPVDTLESKLDNIMQKRAKRIETFENYLNDWEKIKSERSKSVIPKADKPKLKPQVAKKLVKKPILKAQPLSKSSFKPLPIVKSTPMPIQKPKSMKQNIPAKSTKNIKKMKKVTTSLYLSRLNPNGINNLTSLCPILRQGTPANARYTQK
jgi:hypothetical protein